MPRRELRKVELWAALHDVKKNNHVFKNQFWYGGILLERHLTQTFATLNKDSIRQGNGIDIEHHFTRTARDIRSSLIPERDEDK